MIPVKAQAKALLNRYRARKAIRGALASQPNMPEKLRNALKATLANEGSAQLRAVENRRSSLLRDNTELKLIDFGSGASDSLAEGKAEGAMLTSSVSRAASFSKPTTWALLLHHLVKAYRPNRAIELGTCVGISGSYIATAFSRAGHLFTFEGDPERARISRETFQTLGLADKATVVVGRFDDTLAKTAAENAPIDLVFIDGHHDGDATVRYFEQISASLSSGAVVVFDDIRWSDSMKRGWEKLKSLPQTKQAVDLGAMGLVVV